MDGVAEGVGVTLALGLGGGGGTGATLGTRKSGRIESTPSTVTVSLAAELVLSARVHLVKG